MIAKIIAKVKTEPVRLRLYSIIGALAAFALLKGYVQVGDVDFILTIAALVLGVETSRAKVSPTPGPKRRKRI